MKNKAPRFWHDDNALFLPIILTPFSILYQACAFFYALFSTPKALGVPVICVGNLVAGGAGKTPTAIAISKLLYDRGENPHFLCRGYGGRLKGPIKVNPDIHTVRCVGDEALLLASRAPTWVSKNKLKGANTAAKNGASIIIMDDGYQNRSVKKNMSIIVVDGDFGFGNNRILPAGPLRESPKKGIKRANAIVIIGNKNFYHQSLLSQELLHARFVPNIESHQLRDKTVIAFAGIGRPEKFFNTLRSLGCNLTTTASFPDHHLYSPEEVMCLIEKASELGAELVTTEKDWMRLDLDSQSFVKFVSGDIEWEEPEKIELILSPIIKLGRKYNKKYAS
ncbi:MAG: tetraacyldisaccharide 4'-kinase [Rhodospirillaceae bacterium]|nr:tetraacyldisaccharide 4'-kinase [Rhodospirillaceae bacterium]